MEKDPDGNGKNDTYGFTGSSNLGCLGEHCFDPIFAALHAYKDKWLKDKDGNITFSSIMPEMKTALAKLREMYASGLIDKEFAVRKDPKELIAAGKVGIDFSPWWEPYASLSDSVKNDPKAEWIPLLAPLDAQGKFNMYDQDPVTQFLVVRKGYEHPEAVAKVLNVGTEGIRKLDPGSKDIYKGLNISWVQWPFRLALNEEDTAYKTHLELEKAWEAKDPSKLNDEQKMWYESVKKNDENPKKDMAAWADSMARLYGLHVLGSDNINIVRNAFFGKTKTMELKWSTLQKLEQETFLKIILGEEPVDKFDSFVTEWKKVGGDQITDEVKKEANRK
ncbi:hypothetical protein [Gordoniibacillus kamchatkensis]|uniref:hypothetical protein n=1 Tax=Gordoniibacillus kamchatkensis TaxID=1590651 RepID=UPI002F41E113